MGKLLNSSSVASARGATHALLNANTLGGKKGRSEAKPSQDKTERENGKKSRNIGEATALHLFSFCCLAAATPIRSNALHEKNNNTDIHSGPKMQH